MKICDHSEFMEALITLKTNAWQKAYTVSQNQTFSNFMHTFFTKTKTKK